MQTRTLCVLLVLQAVVSFRAAPRIMHLFRAGGCVRLTWIPHLSSVINWTLRVGLATLSQVKAMENPWLAIIDQSIDIGVKRVLVVLRVSLAALAERGSAIRLEDCECIGLQITAHSDGEWVCDTLTTVFTEAGDPVAILKDGGTDLAKGVRLWREREGKKRVWVIEDIGHVLANGLKAQYANTKSFTRFVAIIHKGAARLRQTTLAFLIPPKLRTKGRFQGISHLGKWAERILKVLADKTETDRHSDMATLRKAMAGLTGLRPFLERFATTALTVAEVMTLLKHHGLNQKPYHHCCQLAEDLPPRAKVKKRLLSWLKRHLHIQCRLGIGQTPLLVSSDIIESLFGTFKHIIARSPQAEMNRTVLVIPALCGKRDPLTIAQAFAHTSHRELQRWEQDQVTPTLRQRRGTFFDTEGYQKPGKVIPAKPP